MILLVWQRACVRACVRVCVCVCVCVCLSVISSELHVRSSPIFAHVTYGRASVLLWRLSGTLRISGLVDDVIFTHKLRLLDVAARLRQRGSHAALSLARRNTRCRQRTLGTTSCTQGLLGRSGRVEYLWHHVCPYCPFA